ncbi:hypothetical protein [Petroclostridium sp. X23]|uniref:hypothetical protein n=1 Tax=Petroclostridium sp. X23 TaxID=3045146 RepID=UPI0024ADA8B5|nr:hypothetical protein [Petroclostridium sp. X23]WHH61797.1 hypothetical protein QKW49_03660 [Petroclostridium sp. X23]
MCYRNRTKAVINFRLSGRRTTSSKSCVARTVARLEPSMSMWSMFNLMYANRNMYFLATAVISVIRVSQQFISNSFTIEMDMGMASVDGACGSVWYCWSEIRASCFLLLVY